MRIKITLLLLGVVPLMGACASQPVSLRPVGPNPYVEAPAAIGPGYLQVFSRKTAITEGLNPTFHQPTDYILYDASGKKLERVQNTTGHYSRTPRLISLPPGTYYVEARAQEWLSVYTPVVIKSGRTTKLHLDADWTPPAGTPQNELVRAPGGQPIGWRSDLPAINELSLPPASSKPATTARPQPG